MYYPVQLSWPMPLLYYGDSTLFWISKIHINNLNTSNHLFAMVAIYENNQIYLFVCDVWAEAVRTLSHIYAKKILKFGGIEFGGCCQH